jgi:hypothetical protein
MNKKHIQDLLDKYFEGETSLREEKELRDFFRKTALLPEEWQSYKQMFAFFESEGQKKMPVQKDVQKRKNIIWLFATTISLAATVLILLTVFIPPTKTQLQPLAIASKQLDTFYAKKTQSKKTETTKPVKSEPKKTDKYKSVPIRRILDDDSSTLLASNKSQKHQEIALTTTINDALAPLDKMQDIKEAMDKFKYFDLMNKYLPGQDISSIIRNNQ